MNILPTDALLIIDIQYDFCPHGALAVPDGDAIIPDVVRCAEQFSTIVLTQDWHPKNHASFASTHAALPFSETTLSYGPQTLWPDHCIQGRNGAQFHNSLHRYGVVDKACAIIRKGMNPNIDSYSAFFENDKTTATGLAGFLRDRNTTRVFVVGLAYDFCVGYTALDARREGFDAVVLKDLTRSIKMPVGDTNTENLMDQQLRKEQVVLGQFSSAPSPVPGSAVPKA